MGRSDQEIIDDVLRGNVDAFEELVERYSEELLNLCYRYLQSATEAEDAVQEVFVKAYQALFRWEPRAKFRTWLYRIAINHCINILNRRKRVEFFSFFRASEQSNSPDVVSYPSNDADAESQLMQEQKHRIIMEALAKLPENQRQVVILYHFQGLSYKEIAEILQVSLSAVESRLFRAKRSLAKILEKYKNKF